jgi:flagellar biogenesis protein FliO
MSERAEFHRRAEECVQRAQQAVSPDQKIMLIEMAQTWLRLADQAARIETLTKSSGNPG